ncbi:MAG: phosphohistidine phosphatase SixA [Deltaproteobacteria bacterium]|nr:phosphohistidine phosphatase SixA [Deltaproteobacteria bacterium]
MIDLYLFRHGDADPRGPDGSDATRALTDRGRIEVREAARGLVRLGVELDVVLTSPLVRARETAAIASEVLRPAGGTHLCDALGPGGSDAALFDEIAAQQGGRVMLVGHIPQLYELASVMVWGRPEGAIVLKKAGLIRVVTQGLPPSARGELH